MEELTLEQMQQCITGTYEDFTWGLSGNIWVEVGEDVPTVQVTCMKRDTQFDCGPDNHYLARGSVDALEQWCRDNPGNGRTFEFRGTNANHLDSVNIILRRDIGLMFNFHVKLG